MNSSLRDNDPWIPPTLVGGAVRARHIVFLFLVIYFLTAVASYKWTRDADPAWRPALQSLVMTATSAMLVAILTAIVPELRRSIPALYRRSRVALQARDVLLFVALGLSWGLGAFALGFVLPLRVWRPELSAALGLIGQSADIGAGYYLLWLCGAVVIAPLAEELLFRGYLQNLWMHRWGTWPGILASSLAFGVAHVQFAVFAAFMGLLFALVYLRYRSLWPGTLMHALYNLAVSPFDLLHLLSTKDPSRLTSPSAWIAEMVLTLAFFPLLYLFWRRFRPAT